MGLRLGGSDRCASKVRFVRAYRSRSRVRQCMDQTPVGFVAAFALGCIAGLSRPHPRCPDCHLSAGAHTCAGPATQHEEAPSSSFRLLDVVFGFLLLVSVGLSFRRRFGITPTKSVPSTPPPKTPDVPKLALPQSPALFSIADGDDSSGDEQPSPVSVASSSKWEPRKGPLKPSLLK